MKKIFFAVTLLVSGLSFAAMEQSVESSMGKIATSANEGVGKVVHGVKQMASKTEQAGASAAQKIENRVEQLRAGNNQNHQQQQHSQKNAELSKAQLVGLDFFIFKNSLTSTFIMKQQTFMIFFITKILLR